MTTFYKREGSSRTWYYPTDVVNIGDNLHVDTHNPKSQGYGGSTFTFELEDGTKDVVKGPWHSSARGMLADVGLDVRDLHLTRIELWTTREVEHEVGYGHSVKVMWNSVKDKPIYVEDKPALGIFMRGERAAHAYAKATGKSVWLHSESASGSSTHIVTPDSEMHIMAKNYE